jgi:predicted RNA binding protein YcfA (HicA-like mRNA interferase family)
LPRLNCTFQQFVAIILAHGFIQDRQGAGSHKIYRGSVGGVMRVVIVAGHRPSDTCKPGTLKSMIRQSGLDEKLFRR